MKLLLELRPALDGHAGIPQETRLLFRALAGLDGVQVEGLLQSSNRLLAPGLPPEAGGWSEDRKLHRLGRVVVSLQPGSDETAPRRALRTARLALASAAMLGGSLLGRLQPLGRFDASRYPDFVWRALFARTLPSEDRDAVVRAGYRVARLPWSAAHAAALAARRFGAAVYPRLDTRGIDVLLAETPYPGRVARGTQLVVRYHDAIPLLMPHTIADRAHHQASHYHALRRNVLDGAWFACVSEASRRDLLSVFPQAEPRAVTIPNMVSHRYFAQDGAADGVAGVLRMRGNRAVEALAGAAQRGQSAAPSAAPTPSPPDYLLMVSTIEPRKNHLTLLAAWERLRNADPARPLHLVLVGMLGWEHKQILHKLLPWVAAGQVHVLDDVPAPELRLLYRHARATVCPSYGEGFGFAGVEAMRCGGVVVASDIAAHREVYADAAEYFDPYSTSALVEALGSVLASDAAARRAELVARGEAVSLRYLPEQVMPRWQAFLGRLGKAA